MKGLLIFAVVIALCAARPTVTEVQGNELVDFVKGFLEGINETGDINKLMKCIKTGEEIFKKVIQALELIKKMNLIDIIKGVTLLVDAIKELLNALQPCMEGFSELKKLMNAITHIDIKKIAMKILTHPVEFIKDVTDAISAFSKKDFHAAGKAVGDLLRRLFLSTAANPPIIDFIAGFLVGINEVKTMDDLLKCVKDADQILEKIVLALKKIATIKFSEMLKGFELLFEAFLELEIMLRPCLQGFTQFNKLIDAIMHADITELLLRVLRNIGPFIQDVNDCIESFDSGDYKQAGQDIGDIMFRLFLAEMSKGLYRPLTSMPGFSFDDFVQMVKGFLTGINQAHNFDDIEKCLVAFPEVWVLVKQAVDDIKKIKWDEVLKDLTKLIEPLLKLIEAFKEVLHSIKPCSKVPEEINAIIKKISEIDAEKLLEKILHNVFQIINDLTEAIKNLTEGKFFQFGNDIGDILYRLILQE